MGTDVRTGMLLLKCLKSGRSDLNGVLIQWDVSQAKRAVGARLRLLRVTGNGILQDDLRLCHKSTAWIGDGALNGATISGGLSREDCGLGTGKK